MSIEPRRTQAFLQGFHFGGFKLPPCIRRTNPPRACTVTLLPRTVLRFQVQLLRVLLARAGSRDGGSVCGGVGAGAGIGCG